MNARFLALALVAAACSRAAQSPSAAAPAAEPATTVKVVNDNLFDMNVFVVSSGQQFRLGRVTGGQTEVFTLPPALVHYATPLRFEMRPVGGGNRTLSETIVVSPGDEVTLMIPH